MFATVLTYGHLGQKRLLKFPFLIIVKATIQTDFYDHVILFVRYGAAGIMRRKGFLLRSHPTRTTARTRRKPETDHIVDYDSLFLFCFSFPNDICIFAAALHRVPSLILESCFSLHVGLVLYRMLRKEETLQILNVMARILLSCVKTAVGLQAVQRALGRVDSVAVKRSD